MVKARSSAGIEVLIAALYPVVAPRWDNMTEREKARCLSGLCDAIASLGRDEADVVRYIYGLLPHDRPHSIRDARKYFSSTDAEVKRLKRSGMQKLERMGKSRTSSASVQTAPDGPSRQPSLIRRAR